MAALLKKKKKDEVLNQQPQEDRLTRYCLNVKKYTKLLKQSIQNAGMDVQPVTGVFRILYI